MLVKSRPAPLDPTTPWMHNYEIGSPATIGSQTRYRMERRLVIRHLSGTKALSDEMFPVSGYKEITVGREPSCDVRYAWDEEDLVSRRHLKITIGQGDTPEFTIADLGSSNGTFLNAHRLKEPAILRPGDVVQVGAGGPKFRFEVDPPAADASQPIRPKEPAVQETASPKPTPRPARRGSRNGVLAAGLILAVIGSAWALLKFTPRSFVEMPRAALYKGRAFLDRTMQTGKVATAAGGNFIQHLFHSSKSGANPALTPAEIVRANADSLVGIEVSWTLIDPVTRLPLRQVYIPNDASTQTSQVPLVPGSTRELPVFVLIAGKGLEPMLAVAENPDFKLVAGHSRGAGVIATSSGVILTDRSLAAPWTAAYEWPSEDLAGVVAGLDRDFKVGQTALIARRQFPKWRPEEPGFLLEDSFLATSGQIKGRQVTAEGRAGSLTVALRNPGSKVPVRQVKTVMASPLAAIEIDPLRVLRQAPICQGAGCALDEQVIVLTVPATPENDNSNAAISARPGRIVKDGATPEQASKDLYEVLGEAAGTTTPGAPVFDAQGRVIAIETGSRPSGKPAVLAAPIRYGLELIGR